MAISSFLARKSALIPRYAIGSDGWTNFYPSPDTSGLAMSNAGYTGSRIVYVSTSDGSNSNDGFSPVSDGLGHGPKLTVYGTGGASTLIRSGFPDWLLYKRTDTFQNGWTTLGNGNMNGIIWGRGRLEPGLIGAYGPDASSSNPMGSDHSGARPIIVPALGYNSSEQFMFTDHWYPGNLVINGIEFYDFRQDISASNSGVIQFRGSITSGTNQITGVTNFTNLTVGMKVLGPGTRGLTISALDSVGGTITLSGTVSVNVSNAYYQAYFTQLCNITFQGHTSLIYVEDCFFHFSELAIAANGLGQGTTADTTNASSALFDGPSRTRDIQVIVRRNVFWKSYNAGGNQICLFMGDMAMQRMPTIVEENFLYQGGWSPEILGGESAGTTHNAYCHDMHGTHIFAGNITASASTNGYMQRNGSRAYNNLYVENPYGSVSGTGVTDQAVTISYNSFIQGAGQRYVNLIATANSPAGSTTIQVDGLVSTPAGSFSSQVQVGWPIKNLDNPGSLPNDYTKNSGGNTAVNSIGADSKTITLNNGTLNGSRTVAAGTRGDGVKIGDRIQVSTSIGNGANIGTTSGYLIVAPPSNTTTSYTYPVGSTGPFYLCFDKTIPSWVSVGFKVGSSVSAWGNTSYATIATISADRRSFTTNEVTTAGMLSGDGREFVGGNIACNNCNPQAYVTFYNPSDIPGSQAHYPLYRIGPNNIFANNESPDDNKQALYNNPATINADASGNYIYKWWRTGANMDLNFSDSGAAVTGLNTGFNAAAQAFCQNTNSGLPGSADNLTLEAYMTSLSLTATKDAFYAAARDNRRGSFDARFTANAVNNYFRGICGIAPLTITYPAYDYNTAS